MSSIFSCRVPQEDAHHFGQNYGKVGVLVRRTVPSLTFNPVAISLYQCFKLQNYQKTY